MQTCHSRDQMVSETTVKRFLQKSDNLIMAAVLSAPEVKTVSLRCLVHMNSCGSNTPSLIFRGQHPVMRLQLALRSKGRRICFQAFAALRRARRAAC